MSMRSMPHGASTCTLSLRATSSYRSGESWPGEESPLPGRGELIRLVAVVLNREDGRVCSHAHGNLCAMVVRGTVRSGA